MNSNRFIETARKAVLKYIVESLYPDTRLKLDDVYVITMYGNKAFLGTALLDMIYYEVILNEQAETVELRVFDLMEEEHYRLDQIQ